MLLALFKIPAHVGYVALGALIGAESAGVPLPGETALITAGVLAHKGDFSIELVIVVAAVGAIVGDNIGYLIGRHGGRRLLERPGPFEHHRREIIARGEPFFERHGPKAVLLGRWIAWLRITSAWLAGINHMRWPVFLFWNALGGIAWALSVGLLAYFLGHAAEDIFKIGGIAVVVFAAVLIGTYVLWRRRVR
jgi:membrane-associated protein